MLFLTRVLFLTVLLAGSASAFSRPPGRSGAPPDPTSTTTPAPADRLCICPCVPHIADRCRHGDFHGAQVAVVHDVHMHPPAALPHLPARLTVRPCLSQYVHQPWEHEGWEDHLDMSDEDDVFLVNLKAAQS